MRNLSPSAIATLASADGIEPILIVRVAWNDSTIISYSDRAFPQFNLVGKLLEVTNFDSFVNMETGGSTATVTVKLDDTDGQCKAILNNVDIQKRPVVVYQWFSNLPISDAFIIFEGLINTPISWKEGDRTLSFEAITRLEDVEVGFSVEDGEFTNVPVEFVGKVWPLAFGTVINMPALIVDRIPSGVTRFPQGVADSSLAEQIVEIQCQVGKQLAVANCLSLVGATLQFQADLGAEGFGEKNKELFDKGTQFQQRASDIRNQVASNISKDLHKLQRHQSDQQTRFDTTNFEVLNGWKFIQNTPVGIMIGDNHYYGVFTGDMFHVITRRTSFQTIPLGAPHPPVADYQEVEVPIDLKDDDIVERDLFGLSSDDDFFTPTPQDKKEDPCGPHNLIIIDTGFCSRFKQQHSVSAGQINQAKINEGKFQFIQAGTAVRPDANYPIRYVVNTIPGTQVLGVAARASFGGIKVLMGVPSYYYTWGDQTFGTVTATVLTLSQPLSSIVGYDFSDEVFVTVHSPVGPNTADIMAYIIGRWAPGYAIDPTTFADVRARLDPFPSNFVTFDKKNVFETLKEIAYQCRTMVVFGQNTFFFRYLPAQPTPVDSISESDIENKSLEVTTSRTEDLITQYKAKWKNDRAQLIAPFNNNASVFLPNSLIPQGPNLGGENILVLQNNVAKYGLHKKEYNIFIYDEESLVEKTALFWLIRGSNTFKRIKFKALLHKINLEPLDAVTLNFANNYVANGPVIGIVEKASFNPNDFTIDMDIWVPVLLGQMVQFNDALPADYVASVLGLQDQEMGSQAPNNGAHGDLTGIGVVYNVTNTKRKSPRVSASDIGYTQTTPTGTTIINMAPAGVASARSNATAQPQRNPGYTTQAYRQYNSLERPRLAFDGGAVPGQIVSKAQNDGDGAIFNVNVFINGLTKDPSKMQVKQLQLDPNADIPVNTWVLVTRQFVVIPGLGTPKVEVGYFMTVPVWLDSTS